MQRQRLLTNRYTCSCQRLILSLVIVTILSITQSVCSQQTPSKDKLIVETLLRLKRYDVSENENWKAAISRHLLTIKGTPRYLEIVKAFGIQDAIPDLLSLAISAPTETIGVNAAALLLDFKQSALLQREMCSDNEVRALAITQAISLGGHSRRNSVLNPIVINTNASRQIRATAIKGIGATKEGQQHLLNLLSGKQIPMELLFITGTTLFASTDPVVVMAAKEFIPLPASANSNPVPPVNKLIQMRGDPIAGKSVFNKKGTCIKCHKIGDVGKDVGPSLTEIGSKLSKEALFVSILDPSAGISHNYETYAIVLNSGNILSGIVVSRSDSEVVLRNAEGIDRVLAIDEIEVLKKTSVSLMPSDLQKEMTVDELVNVVAYLAQLKKMSE